MSMGIYKGEFESTQIKLNAELFAFLERALLADQTVYTLNREDLNNLEKHANTDEEKELIEELGKKFGDDFVITISIA